MEGNDFSKMIKDVEGMDIKEWKEKYPNFYKWLIKNGFRYVPALDKSIDTYCDLCKKDLDVQVITYCNHCNIPITKELYHTKEEL